MALGLKLPWPQPIGSLLAGATPLAASGASRSLKAAGYKSPNEKLNFAAIGSGGQGAVNIHAASPTENIVALCDVDDKQAAGIYKQYEAAPCGAPLLYVRRRGERGALRAPTPTLPLPPSRGRE